MTLADLERQALEGNPTLAQAEAAIRAAEGRRVQAGLMPNPIIGYQAEELAFRAIGEKSEHLGFIEQTIPLGGKLRKSRAILPRRKSGRTGRRRTKAAYSQRRAHPLLPGARRAGTGRSPHTTGKAGAGRSQDYE